MNRIFSGQAVIFRADASLQIGHGHVMRCLTLADGLAGQGAKCIFVCREHSGNLIGKIKDRGFPVHVLQVSGVNASSETASRLEAQLAHADWLGVTQDEDAVQCAPILQQWRPHWLVADHYALDARWERIVKPEYTRLLIIDDLADRLHIADLLLDQNLGHCAEDYAGLVPATCRVFTGPNFALLRPEFAELRKYSLKRREQPKLEQLLITMGGIDRSNATGRVLDVLKECSLPETSHITVVMGSKAPWFESIRMQAAVMPWTTDVKADVTNMAHLMAESDLVIGAAGGTAWERCCLGVPSLTAVLADNQTDIAAGLEKSGAALSLGNPLSPSFGYNLKQKISSLLNNLSELKSMGMAAAKVTEGNGLRLVLEQLHKV